MYYQNDLYYIPVHHHSISNGHKIEDVDDNTGNKGAVAKLLQDDLNWASKYLRSNSISRASSVSRSSVSPSRSQSVGREINGKCATTTTTSILSIFLLSVVGEPIESLARCAARV